MRRILQATGCEVIHLGHNRSVEEIVDCAIQEDAHGIAISSYQGGHVEFFKYMLDLLRERGAGHIKVFGGGGGVIVAAEIERAARLRRHADLLAGGRPEARPAGDDQRDRRRGGRRPDADVSRIDRGARPTATASRARARSRGRSPRSKRALRRRRTTQALREAAAKHDDAGARHHRHRRRGQELADRRAGAPLPPRPAATGCGSRSSRSIRRGASRAARCSATASG